MRNDNAKNCPVCGVKVKKSNLQGHLKRVHNINKNPETRVERSTNQYGKRAELRKELVMEKRRKQDILFVIFIIIFAVVGIGGYLFYSNMSNSNENSDNVADIEPEPVEDGYVITENNEVQIATSKIDDGKAHFYTYDTNGVQVRFFVLKSSDGVLRAAFDTCDTCYREKKGYRQEGDDMVCNNCGLKFASIRINEQKGGCNPAPLDRRVDSENLYININDIKAGSWYFE